jgi:hypothetical protein
MCVLTTCCSHGVWGLDDYHCLVFLWGSAQLVNNSDELLPSSVHAPHVLEELSGEYLYLEGIQVLLVLMLVLAMLRFSPSPPSMPPSRLTDRPVHQENQGVGAVRGNVADAQRHQRDGGLGQGHFFASQSIPPLCPSS